MWVEARKQDRELRHYTEASRFIDWPDLQPPPQQSEDTASSPEMQSQDLDESRRQILLGLAWSKRRDLTKGGRDFLDWQRPPKHRIPAGACVLGTGAVICNKSTENLGN